MTETNDCGEFITLLSANGDVMYHGPRSSAPFISFPILVPAVDAVRSDKCPCCGKVTT